MKNLLLAAALLSLLAPMVAIGEQADNAQEKKQNITPTPSLNLTLRGIIAGDDDYPGLAIIQLNDDNEEQVFIVNDDVFGLATLQEVYKDHVILLHNNKLKTMRLDGEALPSEHYLDSAEVRAARKRVATDYRKRLLSRSGMDLINLFGFRPFHQGGFQGFIIMALGDEGREMMETLGVIEGDLITVVNGMRLSEDLEAIDKLKELKTATSVNVIIERNGNELPFYFEFEAPIENNETENTKVVEAKESSGNQTAPIPSTDAVETSEQLDKSQTNAITKTTTANDTQNEAIVQAEDDELGEDWGESQEDQLYMDEQRANSKQPTERREVEFDH